MNNTAEIKSRRPFTPITSALGESDWNLIFSKSFTKKYEVILSALKLQENKGMTTDDFSKAVHEADYRGNSRVGIGTLTAINDRFKRENLPFQIKFIPEDYGVGWTEKRFVLFLGKR